MAFRVVFDGVSVWQAGGSVHFHVARHVFRLASVWNGGNRLRRVRACACGESCTERAFRLAGVGNRELLDFTSTCLPGRNRGRRRVCADLWMYTRGGRFAIRNVSLMQRLWCLVVFVWRSAVASCEQ